MPDNKRVRGRVFSGRGEGEIYINIYARAFEKTLGYRPYPGTLNIRLIDGRRSRLLGNVKPIIVKPPELPGTRLAEVECYRARIEDLDNVYIIVPRIKSYYGDNIIEVIAPINLRRKFNLNDGDIVVLEIL